MRSEGHYDLIIAGGGLAGASLAVALRDCKLRIALIEGRPPTALNQTWDARVYAVSPASLRFLETCGTLGHLDPGRIGPVYDMAVTGDRFGQIRFSAYDTGVESLASIMESSRLHAALWAQLQQQANVTLFCPGRSADLRLNDDAASITLDNGERLTARLVVAADGRDSALRHSAGLRAKTHDYNELGVVANFQAERDHRGCAYQWFREDQSVLAWLPLPDQHISMVWSCPPDLAKILLDMPPDELADAVGGAGADALGALTCVTPAQAFPLKLITVAQTTAQRFALLGDAAHGIHPLSGHGINLGFSDASVLSALLRDAARAGDDPGSDALLRRYASQRRQETFLLQQGTHALHELFRSRLPGLSLLRNFGLDLTQRLGPVKSLLARIAMG